MKSGAAIFGDFQVALQDQLKTVKLQIDTGAEVSLLEESLFRELWGPNKKLKRAREEVKSFDGRPVKVLGVVPSKVQFGPRSQRGEFHVVPDGNGSLIGNNFLIPLKVEISCGARTVKAATVSIAGVNLEKKFPRLFSDEMGTYSGQPHTIHLQPDAVPRAVRVRPVPLARQEAVNKAIKELDDLGIWEEVTQSEWAHPMVTVSKPDGGIRITTDLTALNLHVIPERFPLPRIKDILCNLSGSRYFSKLDLKKGYFHILLEKESQDLTTTITPLGLRRYLRLPMGPTDSASAFQRRVQQTLAGLQGVEAYIDDIIVHGKRRKEHDQRLVEVLERLQDKDSRLQPKKLQIAKDTIFSIRIRGVGGGNQPGARTS